MRHVSIYNALALFIVPLLGSCRKDDSRNLKAIEDELKESNARLEEMQKNQIKEREGKAMENMKSYFQ